MESRFVLSAAIAGGFVLLSIKPDHILTFLEALLAGVIAAGFARYLR